MNDGLFRDDIEKALEVLHAGGTLLYPTDTIWGLGCDATNTAAAEKIFQLKNRPAQKSFVVLIADERDILKYTASPDLAIFDYLENCIKPTTVIYEHALGLAENITAADGSVAIRICKDEFCRHLIKRFRKPIISTSANTSGMPAPADFYEVEERIKSGVDYVVKYRQQEIIKNVPSAIIKWQNGSPLIIRE